MGAALVGEPPRPRPSYTEPPYQQCPPWTAGAPPWTKIPCRRSPWIAALYL